MSFPSGGPDSRDHYPGDNPSRGLPPGNRSGRDYAPQDYPTGGPVWDPGRAQTEAFDVSANRGFDGLPQIDEPNPDVDRKARKKARRRKVRKILLVSLVVLVVLSGGAAFAGWRYLRSVEGDVTKVDAFDAIPEVERPVVPPAQTKAINILILGSDSRDPDASGSRADTIMVAHVTADHKTAQIVSIPRDTWVDIPKTPDGKHGGVKGKINWSFAWGGIPLMVRSVESFTKVRMDHVIVIDFAGFKEVVDAVGGIDIYNERTFASSFWENNNHVFKEGNLHLNGEFALEYARQRKNLPHGDFDRIKNQQKVVKAVLDKATSAGVIADPGKLTGFLRAVAKTITTDKKFDLISTAMDLRGIKSGQIRFMTSPSKGTGMVGDQSVVFADTAAAASLFDALKKDQGAGWKPA
jgi:LCP family protein required for cell wall assembly